MTPARAWCTGSWAAGLACAADLVLLGIGVLGGADMNVQPPGSTSALAIGPELVVVTAIVPLVPATLLLAAVSRRGSRWWRLLATTGLAVGVVSAAGPLLSTATPAPRRSLCRCTSSPVSSGSCWCDGRCGPDRRWCPAMSTELSYSAEVLEDGDALLAGDTPQLGLRMHVHLTSASPADQQQTTATALGLGARHLDVGQRPEEGHVVLADLEANEFCVTAV
jgi:hypothetical protein